MECIRCASKFLLVAVTLSWLRTISCYTYMDSNTLITSLLSNYSRHVRPITDQSEAVAVGIKMYLKSISEFDEVKERLSIVVALELYWHDENMGWDPATNADIGELTAFYTDVWVPEVILTTPSDTMDSFGKDWQRIRFYNFYYYGLAKWFPCNLIKSTCQVNVRDYPFDTQSCVVSLATINYKSAEVSLYPMSNTISLDVYQSNSLWDLQSTTVERQTNSAYDEVAFTVKLKRKPAFVIINLILPITFLCFLNVLVFALVPESGERLSYCITVLLSIAVFMTIVSSLLPTTSKPVPLISYKLFIDLVLSALVVFVTIMNLRLYHKDEQMPVTKWLQKLYIILICCRRQKKLQLNDQTTSGKTTGTNLKTTATSKEFKRNDVQKEKFECTPTADKERISWKQISSVVDWISLSAFTAAFVVNTAVYFILTTGNSA